MLSDYSHTTESNSCTTESDIRFKSHSLAGEEVHEEGREGGREDGLKDGKEEGRRNKVRKEERTKMSMYACSFVCYTTEYDRC